MNFLRLSLFSSKRIAACSIQTGMASAAVVFVLRVVVVFRGCGDEYVSQLIFWFMQWGVCGEFGKNC